VMRWPVDLDLLPATDRLVAAFRLVTTFGLVTTLFAGELNEAKGELSPMSRSNHIQSPARAACVNAMVAINVMNSVFIRISLCLTISASLIPSPRRVRGIVFCRLGIKENSLFRGTVRYHPSCCLLQSLAKPSSATDARADGM
jgi:hypothetical protein